MSIAEIMTMPKNEIIEIGMALCRKEKSLRNEVAALREHGDSYQVELAIKELNKIQYVLDRIGF